MEYPMTRQIIGELDGWLRDLAAPHLPLKRVKLANGAFHWAFTHETPEALLVGKAVTMVSAINAALFLADSGFTAECHSLLRMVSDLSHEMVFVVEGLLPGGLNDSQQQFVRQYFISMPQTEADWERLRQGKYVSRKEILKAQRRLATKGGVDADKLHRLTLTLNQGYDQYVHGGYLTAMELFNGLTNQFMLHGHESKDHWNLSTKSVAGKLNEVLAAIELASLHAQMVSLAISIANARHRLEASGES